MNINNLKSVYFIGVGGIGMSALARFFLKEGAAVSGYDKTPTPLTKKLASSGININYEDDIQLLKKNAELVVYTPAIPQDHAQLNWYREQGYPVYKRSDVLQWITEQMFSITIGGTHGKTTMSTMIAHILRDSGYGCNAFLGGISVNYDTNYWHSENKVAVIEADEYDRSFLKLKPDIAVLSAMDADHLDVYGSKEAMEEAYVAYTRQLGQEGTLLYKHGLKQTAEMGGGNKIGYSLQNDAAGAYARNIVIADGGYNFDLICKEFSIENIRLNLGGMHNVENAVAAMTVAHLLKIDPDKIKEAIASFQGIKRRFEYLINNEQVTYIDDYAHHPEELRSLIRSAKLLFPERKCMVVFQPHLYSRTRDLAEEFAESLDLADQVLLLDIYPARELPIAGVSSQIILEKLHTPATILSAEGIKEFVSNAPVALFITAGAGDIDKLVEPIKEILQKRYGK